MLSVLNLQKLSIPHHLVANTYFYPCLGQQFFKKSTHLLLQVLEFVCHNISYSIYQQRGLPKYRHAGRVSPKRWASRDSHTCPLPALLEILDLNQASIKATQSIKALKGKQLMWYKYEQEASIKWDHWLPTLNKSLGHCHDKTAMVEDWRSSLGGCHLPYTRMMKFLYVEEGNKDE